MSCRTSPSPARATSRRRRAGISVCRRRHSYQSRLWMKNSWVPPARGGVLRRRQARNLIEILWQVKHVLVRHEHDDTCRAPIRSRAPATAGPSCHLAHRELLHVERDHLVEIVDEHGAGDYGEAVAEDQQPFRPVRSLEPPCPYEGNRPPRRLARENIRSHLCIASIPDAFQSGCSTRFMNQRPNAKESSTGISRSVQTARAFGLRPSSRSASAWMKRRGHVPPSESSSSE